METNNKSTQQVWVSGEKSVYFDFDSLNIDNPLQVCQKYRNELQIPLRSIILINLAEMNSNNNQHMLIQAVKDLRDRNMDVYLLLVGKDCLDGECQEQASQLEVQQFTRFLGVRNDIGELLAASNIYVASSKTEKCPLGIIQAQYAHLPVVATGNKGHKAVIEDGLNGFLVPTGDAKTMAERILLLLEKPTTYKDMSQVDVSTYISKGVPVIDDDF